MSDPVKIILSREVFPLTACEGRVGNVLVIENDPLPSPPDPPVAAYQNAAKSVEIQRNDCGTGKTGTTVTYTVAAGKYSSEESQEAADALAQADLDKNAQAYVNLHGSCELTEAFQNAVYRKAAAKSDCKVKGNYGNNVIYTVPEGKYSSWISQGDADAQAKADADANAQAFADLNGSCSIGQPAVKLYVEAPDDCNYYIRYAYSNPSSANLTFYNPVTYQKSEIPCWIFQSSGLLVYRAMIEIVFPDATGPTYKVHMRFPDGSASKAFTQTGTYDIRNNPLYSTSANKTYAWLYRFTPELYSEVTITVTEK
jgi:hypothetical protein